MTRIITAFLLFASLGLKAQTADEIIARHIEARGGADKIRALQSMVTHGVMNQGGVDVDMNFTYVHDKAYRVDFTAAGQSGYNVVTTKEGWFFNPFMGHTEPQAMEADQLKEAQAQLDMQGPLFDYKAKGNKVEYLGKESAQGAEFYKVKLTRASGSVVTYYFDKNYLTAKTVSTAVVEGNEQEVITEYEDYRKTPEGYMIAYKRINRGTEINLDKVEINSKVDESLFKVK